MAYEGFAKLKGQLAHRPGVTNPGALAAYIGRKKYGASKFNQAAASGTSMRGDAIKRALGKRGK
jgi:hypothetical protein